jgi:hypothetical protein
LQKISKNEVKRKEQKYKQTNKKEECFKREKAAHDQRNTVPYQLPRKCNGVEKDVV